MNLGVALAPPPIPVSDFAGLLELSLSEQVALEGFEQQSRNGRPMGDAQFIAKNEAILDRILTPQKRGPKRKAEMA